MRSAIRVFIEAAKDADARSISAFTRVFRRAMRGHHTENSIRTDGTALGGAAVAPQLTDRGVGKPPHIPLAVLRQARQAFGEPCAHMLRIRVRELGIGFDELP